VNADDFGMTDGVCEGIIQTWQNGIVTSTSAMINMPGAPERVIKAHTLYPDLPIGLHINITEGRPVLPASQVPTLVNPEGTFNSVSDILAHLADISLSEFQAELNAQAEALLACGVGIDHLDYHHHMVAIYSRLFPVVRDLARRYGVPVRQPVPISLYNKINLQKDGDSSGSSGTNEAIGKLLPFILLHPFKAFAMMGDVGPAAFERQADLLKQDGIPAPDWFVEGFYGNATVSRLISIIGQLPPGVSELMTHPAVDTGYEEDRIAEVKALTSPEVRTALENTGIRLVNYSFLVSGKIGR
jgi:predicted glycoside hydrolase/deacetylase ChbG (UPF0249 family)